ncbi:Ribokinase-like protein [Myxozyma melibiosi]|uniref:ATP-dependent (S)-NAD(P)H-hydrate dehydratase n=1 Tax=Myxozyma melibiosi TaxID=54550 RepID=A0ABR1F0T1_9ASCO
MASSRESQALLAEIKKFIPPLLEKFHKGQAGRIAVIGGCEDYTGAPFFAAQSATLLGVDMAHVICESLAGPVIKSYSPNLMVHPYLRDSKTLFPLHSSSSAKPSPAECSATIDSDILPPIYALLSRLHVLVIGPGLGRDPVMQEIARKVILKAKSLDLHLVIDADGLFLVQHNPDIIKGYSKALLTPNIVEFKRLCNAMSVSIDSDESPQSLQQACHSLALAYSGPTIIAKGHSDYISNGDIQLVCSIPGGKKRVGGQGDTLSGTAATFLAWKYAYQSHLWDHDNDLTAPRLMALSAYGAAAVTRFCSCAAYAKYRRAMLASNLSEMISDAYSTLFEDQDSSP